MDLEQLDLWFPLEKRRPIIENIAARVGVTHTRAEYFVRLCVYLMVKQLDSGMVSSAISTGQRTEKSNHTPPFEALSPLAYAMSCSHSEAAWLFYGDKDQGSDRAAGMMLDKLAALGLIQKHFDGNTTRIQILLDPNELSDTSPDTTGIQPESSQQTMALSSAIPDAFDPRCDAVPIANLLAVNYGWMNRSLEIVPHRITRLLRRWGKEYPTGMRVLRRTDNLNPVGFYLLYPTTADSEIVFSGSPTKGLHLASLNETDPFTLATPGDLDCLAVFVRSWMIDPDYLEQYRTLFLQDAQQTLRNMQKDFPNLCDLYTLIIHPSYESMASKMAFQKIGTQTSRDTQLYWMYQALDRYLELDLEAIFG